jgi:hypothetical protein
MAGERVSALGLDGMGAEARIEVCGVRIRGLDGGVGVGGLRSRFPEGMTTRKAKAKADPRAKNGKQERQMQRRGRYSFPASQISSEPGFEFAGLEVDVEGAAVVAALDG